MDSPDPGFVDDIVQNEPPQHLRPRRDRFLPWHRVRKQFIREEQWNKAVFRAAERFWKNELAPVQTGGRTAIVMAPLRCLVIPGEDLLDLRSLWRAMRSFNCAIRYLGFNAAQGSQDIGTNVYVANNAVTSLEGVVTNSQVVRDRFEAIANEKSKAYQSLLNYGPYHVVNLDLCNSMVPNTQGNWSAYYDALVKLLQYQFHYQRLPWILLVTTHAQPDIIDTKALSKMGDPTNQNYRKNAAFAEKVAAMFPKSAFREDGTFEISELNNSQVADVFGVVFGKWILSLCEKANPRWAAVMKTSFRYPIDRDTGAVMLSLSFLLRPAIPELVDETGSGKMGEAAENCPDEAACAVTIAEKVGEMQDVVELLDANQERKAALTDAQATLLAEAGYDREAYLQWVAGGEHPENN